MSDVALLDGLSVLDETAKAMRLAEEAGRKLSRARTRLIMGRDPRTVFFATIAMRLKAEPQADQKTARTDGKVLRYNPQYLAD